MKTIKLITLLAISLAFASCKTEGKSTTQQIDETIARVEVIDFYGAHRCVTCKAIEASAKYTVETYFEEEQKQGKVVFRTVNVEKDENYEIAERFEAAGTALFLNVVKDGKERHIDLTDFGFSKGKDQEVFSDELKIKIETELKTL